jgi:hypothetical protein
MSKKVIFSGQIRGKSVLENYDFMLLTGESPEEAIYVTIDEAFDIDDTTFAKIKDIMVRDKKISKIVSKRHLDKDN